MNSQLHGGSICMTDLIETMKLGHSAFSKAQNGKVYFNILIWQNEEPDKFGNNMSLQLSSSKDMREKEDKVYIGNAKKLETNRPVGAKDIPSDNWDANIPVREKQKSNIDVDKMPTDDGLPF